MANTTIEVGKVYLIDGNRVRMDYQCVAHFRCLLGRTDGENIYNHYDIRGWESMGERCQLIGDVPMAENVL